MAKKKAGKHNIFVCIFATVIIVGLVLAIVGMCINVIKATTTVTVLGKEKVTETFIKLFDKEWADYKEHDVANNTFLIISFIVTLVGLAVLLADSCLHLFAKKDLKILRIIGAALAIVGAILILVAGLTLVGAFNDAFSADGGVEGFVEGSYKHTAAAGVWLGFVGGLVGGVAGGLGLLKQFN